MSKNRKARRNASVPDNLATVPDSPKPERRRFFLYSGTALFIVLVTLGVFASNGWFPRIDPFSGKRYGWFGQPLSKNAPSAWNPLAAPPPEPTPQLSKEYIHAGSRLLAVEDKNASAVPPADLAIWRPGPQAVWYVRIDASNWTTHEWGEAGDIPVAGDFDGDGTTDFSVWRPSNYTWYVVPSSNPAGWYGYQFGTTGDIPASADYDGDGKTDPAVYRPPTGGGNGIWYVQGSTAGFYSQSWGIVDDIPASADYDGDGRADFGVFRPDTRTFYSINSSNGAEQTITTGLPTGSYNWCNECAVSSDYDGDGKADYAVFDQLAANWYIKPSSGTMSTLGTPSTTTSGGFGVFQWGASGDRPVHNDYDSDAKTDIATWRNGNGTWYIRQSASGNSLREVQWGQSGDTPVPAFFRR